MVVSLCDYISIIFPTKQVFHYFTIIISTKSQSELFWKNIFEICPANFNAQHPQVFFLLFLINEIFLNVKPLKFYRTCLGNTCYRF